MLRRIKDWLSAGGIPHVLLHNANGAVMESQSKSQPRWKTNPEKCEMRVFRWNSKLTFLAQPSFPAAAALRESRSRRRRSRTETEWVH